MTLKTTTDALVVRAWDGNSLTLFGVLYGILVTVVGVVVAILTSSWVWVSVYAVLSLVGLAVLLLFFGQPIIEAMRWVTERG